MYITLPDVCAFKTLITYIVRGNVAFIHLSYRVGLKQRRGQEDIAICSREYILHRALENNLTLIKI